MAGGKKADPEAQESCAPPHVQIPRRFGGGVLKKRTVCALPFKKVIQYALACINPLSSAATTAACWVTTRPMASRTSIHGRDDGEASPGYAALYDRFDAEWKAIALEFVNGSKK